MKLFLDNLGTAATDQELDAIIARHSQFHESYIAICCHPRGAQFKKLLAELWGKYEPYADKDFRKKLPLEFLPRCWEMFVTVVLLGRGFTVIPKSSAAGPDVHIKHGGKDVWVEAVVATAGQGADAVPDMLYGVAQHVPEKEMLLRLRQSLDAKFKQYEKYVQDGIVKPDDPFVIAVSRGPIEHVEADPPLITKCLFPIGRPVLSIPKDSGQPQLTSSYRLTVTKQSGASVPMNFFVDPAHAGISAVIYCKNNILNHPEPHGSDFVLVHNPNAANPLPINFLGIGTEWVPENNGIKLYDRNK